MSSIIETLQQECADRLAALPYFAHIPVLVETLKDLQSEYQRALGPLQVTGGKSGAVVTLGTPTANVNWTELGGPFFDDIPLTVEVRENRAVNQDPAMGTLQSALAICEQVAAALTQFFPLSATGPVVPRHPTIVRVPDDDSVVQYHVQFTTMGGLSAVLPAAATPTSAVGGGQTTLSCATPGAAIFYTQDGTNPNPRGSVLYTAPFTPTGPLKARAWLAGYLASGTLSA
jgi:hypothetical protein